MNENPGKLKLGKGVYFVKTHLKRLPQTEDVWQADIQPFHEAGRGRKRQRPCWLGVVLSRTDDFILADRVLDTPPTVKDRIDYEVEWDRRTLDAMHPVYKKRCVRDGLKPETMWLTEEDVEPDDGIPVPIEPPTRIVTPPLSEKDQDDRVRKALGLTHDDPLPDLTDEALLAYHRYLAANLTFPLHITSWEKSGPFASKKVTIAITKLADPQAGRIDEDYGLIGLGRNPKGEEIEFPLGEIDLGKKDPNRRLLSDYAYWFYNWR